MKDDIDDLGFSVSAIKTAWLASICLSVSLLSQCSAIDADAAEPRVSLVAYLTALLDVEPEARRAAMGRIEVSARESAARVATWAPTATGEISTGYVQDKTLPAPMAKGEANLTATWSIKLFDAAGIERREASRARQETATHRERIELRGFLQQAGESIIAVYFERRRAAVAATADKQLARWHRYVKDQIKSGAASDGDLAAIDSAITSYRVQSVQGIDRAVAVAEAATARFPAINGDLGVDLRMPVGDLADDVEGASPAVADALGALRAADHDVMAANLAFAPTIAATGRANERIRDTYSDLDVRVTASVDLAPINKVMDKQTAIAARSTAMQALAVERVTARTLGRTIAAELASANRRIEAERASTQAATARLKDAEARIVSGKGGSAVGCASAVIAVAQAQLGEIEGEKLSAFARLNYWVSTR